MQAIIGKIDDEVMKCLSVIINEAGSTWEEFIDSWAACGAPRRGPPMRTILILHRERHRRLCKDGLRLAA
jgi:hypothetical protein